MTRKTHTFNPNEEWKWEGVASNTRMAALRVSGRAHTRARTRCASRQQPTKRWDWTSVSRRLLTRSARMAGVVTERLVYSVVWKISRGLKLNTRRSKNTSPAPRLARPPLTSVDTRYRWSIRQAQLLRNSGWQQAQAYVDHIAFELAPNLGESWDWTSFNSCPRSFRGARRART